MVKEASLDESEVVADKADIEAVTGELGDEIVADDSDTGAALGEAEGEAAADESGAQASADASSKKAMADGSDILSGLEVGKQLWVGVSEALVV